MTVNLSPDSQDACPAIGERNVPSLALPQAAARPSPAGTSTYPPLGVVITGGTIGSTATRSVVSLSPDEGGSEPELGFLRDAVAALESDRVVVCSPLRTLSEDLVPSDWVKIANAISHLVGNENLAAVLVLHGTDTMSYTAAALSFLLADMKVPIVLTGSNVPLDAPGSDAPKNVHDALVALPCLSHGTYVAFAGSPDLPGLVHVGTRVRKVTPFGQTFVSSGRPPVARIVGERFLPLDLPDPPTAIEGAKCAVDGAVTVVRLFPGIDFAALEHSVIRAGMRGVVVELYPTATGPVRGGGRFSLPRFVRKCVDAGVIVVTTSPSSVFEDSARQHVARYPASEQLRDAGAMFLGDTLTETAAVKLMWALAQSSDGVEVKRIMARSLAHEMVGGS